MVFALDLASLSLAPVDCAGRGLVQTGKDVLRCWPHENGIMAWLKKEQPKYNLYPSQKILWAETIKYPPILEAGLARAQSRPPPQPDFDSPGESAQPPAPNWG